MINLLLEKILITFHFARKVFVHPSTPKLESFGLSSHLLAPMPGFLHSDTPDERANTNEGVAAAAKAKGFGVGVGVGVESWVFWDINFQVKIICNESMTRSVVNASALSSPNNHQHLLTIGCGLIKVLIISKCLAPPRTPLPL